MVSGVRDAIEKIYFEVLEESGVEPAGALSDEDVLLDGGLDSLGFAILVARLDEDLGLDPFSESETAFYPRTFGEFVGAYEKVAANAPAAGD